MEDGWKGEYARWEEVVVSNDKGRRVVHYYLHGAVGAELAVVGRERSVRHMSYAVPGRFLDSLPAKPPHLAPASPLSSLSSPSPPDSVALKWKTRREIIDWLSSLVSDSFSYGSSPVAGRFSDDEDAGPLDTPASKGLSSGKMGNQSKAFSWLGSAWTCRKRRKHYRSFCRNGITVSVHDFVYIMSEESKRLVAYVEDLYEDLRANHKVVVRWFHKVDEVGIILPPDVSDREIFFSLCLQDFSVECIDGLAAVLSSQHYEKFQSEARQSTWDPYLCCRQIDNDDVKPFDITQVQGYWSQELLRSFYTPSLKLRLKINHGGYSPNGNGDKGAIQVESKKAHLFNNGDVEGAHIARNTNKSRGLCFGSRMEKHVRSSNMSPPLLRKELLKHRFRHQQLGPGCQVEVLSQNSGMRGCWFRCRILKRHQDKVKVRYQDVQDVDGTGNLEEWMHASRVADPDKLSIRLNGRPMIRPLPSNRDVCKYVVGAVVDAWWHDGWWEGVALKSSEGKLQVYFPGEQLFSVFDQDDLRHSQDWVGNKWNPIKDRPDVASNLSAAIGCKSEATNSDGSVPLEASNITRQHYSDLTETPPTDEELACKPIPVGEPLVSERCIVPNLAKHCQLDGLKWSSSRKRRRGRELSKDGSCSKRRSDGSSSSAGTQEDGELSNASGGFELSNSLTVDHEVCKIGGDLQLPMTLCSSLVMSR